jgi:hypothetical protein
MSDIEQRDSAQERVGATRALPVSVLGRSRYICAAGFVTLGLIGSFIWMIFLGWCVFDGVHALEVRVIKAILVAEEQTIALLRQQEAEARTINVCRKPEIGGARSPC